MNPPSPATATRRRAETRRPRGASRLRAAVYGALILAASGLGCGPKSCSCKGLPTGLLTKPAEKRAFTDVEMLSEDDTATAKEMIVRVVSMLFQLTRSVHTPGSFPPLPTRGKHARANPTKRIKGDGEG